MAIDCPLNKLKGIGIQLESIFTVNLNFIGFVKFSGWLAISSREGGSIGRDQKG